MLIITREAGQSFYITKDIAIRILTCRNGLIRLGIDAPNTMAIWREEMGVQNQQVEQNLLHRLNRKK